jgi:hypothetical protein
MRGEEETSKPVQDTKPKWLMEEEAGTELPSWLSSGQDASAMPSEAEDAAPQEEVVTDDVPDWLRSTTSGAEVPLFNEETAAESEETTSAEPFEMSSAGQGETSSEAPDWLNNFQSVEAEQPSESFSAEKIPSGITEDTLPGGEMDELFSEIPDWLSSSADDEPPSEPLAVSGADPIAPSELPSWVQAMRPVESPTDVPSSGAVPSGDQTLESRGALAGLHGVLPAVPGFTPTSKPKAYSIKLQANDEQLAHAALLEQILAAETEPVPIESISPLGTSQRLRWVIALILLVFLTVPLALRTRIFSAPVGFPNELRDAVTLAQSIPENAPVLVAFDYSPARAGELEAAAAPMFDQMLLLRHPRLTFISTNETGAILAERFISGPLGGHNYQSGTTYLNLGYLPGGQMGIRAFAQEPSTTVLMDISLQPAWVAPPLEGITTLSQFAALILITDNADSARVWIEQTQSLRGNVPFIVIASAQAAPMIQPYYDSRQVNGVVSGLYGGALFEQQNAGRPGTVRGYWDAYSLGLLIAVALIVGGALWNLSLALRGGGSDGEAAKS